jgi:hypothetical protein
MAEPRSEQVIAAVLTKLGAIVGDGGATFWNTPKAVRAFVVNDELLDPSVAGPNTNYDTIIAVTPDRKEEQRASMGGASCLIRCRSFMTLTLLKPYIPATENPHLVEAPDRSTIQERMEQDVRKKLRADRKLGGTASDLELTDSEEGADETYVPGWAVAFMRLVVTFHYPQDTP